MTPEFDVGIIGGGPAGSAAAAYLARAGISCVVFEREQFPRPHVGESLVPSSTRVLKEIGFLDQMEEAGFVRKYGAAWTTTARPVYSLDWSGVPEDCVADVRFEEREQQGVDRPYTYHVDRGAFDLMLLRHAGTLGADVREGVAVQSVDLETGPFPVITTNAGGKPQRTAVRVVLDASGRHTLLGSQLRVKRKDPVFDQFAVHTWFEGYDRGAGGKADYIYIHFLPVANTWVWQIPITDTVTSFGVVTQRKQFVGSRESREKLFWECVATRPEVLERLRQARQIRPWREEGDYSYAMTQICGDGYALIGDAARFVDPIFSSGVSIALNSARLAAADIRRGLERGPTLRRDDFREFETTMRRGTNHWYEFISLYYRLNVMFTYFVTDPRHRLQVLQLLQGDLYDEEEVPVLGRMRELATEVENNPKHLWHALLGDLTAHAFKPVF